MQLNKTQLMAGVFALATTATALAGPAGGGGGGGGRPQANQVLMTRESAQANGFSNFLAVISAWFNNGYLMGLGLAFIVGFFTFIFALMKMKKEKEKPEEQQEMTKYYWFMGIATALMAVTATILAMSDTLGIGTNIGQGVADGQKLNDNKTGYGVGGNGAADGFN